MYDQNVFIHIFAGGLVLSKIFVCFFSLIFKSIFKSLAGTIGAVVTNPLEVVKTRFQSSYHHSQLNYSNTFKSSHFCTQTVNNTTITFKNHKRANIFNFTIYYQ